MFVDVVVEWKMLVENNMDLALNQLKKGDSKIMGLSTKELCLHGKSWIGKQRDSGL